ncbi:YadA-like family protein [Mannheimia pernigra]|uniref:YadA-like family protein n=1 Tax=Mannheimia pernigra TaxID=111844 RepID=UPI00159F3713|nr:YadA-like family protein [Mannheimia pernigra]QLB43905.1 YadA-like family protein [Mannheimia pernigra]
MNKIFKVKKNALGQSVACSELATSRSKSRVVATALALAVASGVSMAQDVQFDIDGTQINDLYKALTGEDRNLQGQQTVKTTLNEFGQFTTEALAHLGKVTYDIMARSDDHTYQITDNYYRVLELKHSQEVTNDSIKAIVTNNERLEAFIKDNEKDIANTVKYVNSVAETADKNAMDIAENKAEVAKIEGLQAQITANQEDSAKNFADTNANIKANKDALETKVEKRDFYHIQDNVNSNNTKIAELQANKADVEYVDNVAEGVLANKVASATNKADIAENKAYLDSVAEGALANKVASTTNKADIAKNKKDIAANKEHVDVLTDTVIANKVDIVHNKAKIHMLETSTLDLTSTKTRVSALENRTSALETRVNKLNKNLSAGIAGTAALSMMPTAGEKGAHYITAGAGHYNGQQAIAIGLTGNSNSGKFNYKVGASATTSGSPVVGAGVGYRWK